MDGPVYEFMYLCKYVKKHGIIYTGGVQKATKLQK